MSIFLLKPLKLKVELSKTFRNNSTKYTRSLVLYVTEFKLKS